MAEVTTTEQIAAASAEASAAAAEQSARALAEEVQIEAAANARRAEIEANEIKGRIDGRLDTVEQDVAWLKENLSSATAGMTTLQTEVTQAREQIQVLHSLLTALQNSLIPPASATAVQTPPTPEKEKEGAQKEPEKAPRKIRFL